MSQFSFKTPDLGEGIVEVEVVNWSIAVGDEVSIDQPIGDVMTDKANIELTSPVNGKVVRLGCEKDQMIAVGAELVLFEISGDTKEEAKAKPQAAAEPASPVVLSSEEPVKVVEVSGTPAEKISPPVSEPVIKPEKRVTSTAKPHLSKPARQILKSEKMLASPAVRRHAHALGIDLSQLSPSGSHGQVTHQDIEQYITDHGLPQVVRDQQIKLSGVRRVIAQKMQIAASTIPHFSYVEEIDLTELESLRKQLNETHPDRTKLTLLPFLMQATVRALRQYPQVNATFDDKAGIINQYAAVHFGIATQTDDGLKVPVIRDADMLDIWQKADQLQNIAQAARDKTIPLKDLSGSTISITSLGKLGGIVSTPIMNKPEVAIIGINKAQDRVVALDGQMVIRRMMNLSSSFDHRIIDGYVGALFIQSMKSFLEHPATLFMP